MDIFHNIATRILLRICRAVIIPTGSKARRFDVLIVKLDSKIGIAVRFRIAPIVDYQRIGYIRTRNDFRVNGNRRLVRTVVVYRRRRNFCAFNLPYARIAVFFGNFGKVGNLRPCRYCNRRYRAFAALKGKGVALHFPPYARDKFKRYISIRIQHRTVRGSHFKARLEGNLQVRTRNVVRHNQYIEIRTSCMDVDRRINTTHTKREGTRFSLATVLPRRAVFVGNRSRRLAIDVDIFHQVTAIVFCSRACMVLPVNIAKRRRHHKIAALSSIPYTNICTIGASCRTPVIRFKRIAYILFIHYRCRLICGIGIYGIRSNILAVDLPYAFIAVFCGDFGKLAKGCPIRKTIRIDHIAVGIIEGCGVHLHFAQYAVFDIIRNIARNVNGFSVRSNQREAFFKGKRERIARVCLQNSNNNTATRRRFHVYRRCRRIGKPTATAVRQLISVGICRNQFSCGLIIDIDILHNIYAVVRCNYCIIPNVPALAYAGCRVKITERI